MKKFLLALGAVCLVSGSALSVSALAQDVKPKTVTKTFSYTRLNKDQKKLEIQLNYLKKELAKASNPQAKAAVQEKIDKAVQQYQDKGMTIDQVNTVLANLQAEEAIASIRQNTEVTYYDYQQTTSTITITFVDPQSGYNPGG
jgi:hypothetical protein